MRRAAFRLGLAVACLLPLAAAAQEVVLVARAVIYPGQTIADELLREVELKPDRIAPPAVARERRELVGKVARKTLLPAHYIPLASVREPYVVEPGAAVQAVFVSGGLTISATAVTLEAGAAGDMVKVRNIDSGKIVSGAVMADGTVRIAAQ